uniref:DUF3038 domain-containing protein n=1 Tax=Cyanothece sp. (strain PCC 7425 / ATCC 29141) TaxID=395961 RepID=B8HS81_CYAP4
MQVDSPIAPVVPPALVNLPDPELVSPSGCPRRTRWQIDLILLALEALDLGGSEAMLALAKELQVQHLIPNRVVLWRLRCTNPFRRFSLGQRRSLSLEELKALVAIGCTLARRQTVLIRQLLMEYQQLKQQELPLDNSPHLSYYLERFRSHFRSRMNYKRTAIAAYKDPEKLNALGLHLLEQLLFCTGTAGTERLWVSLFDGEVV